MFKKATAFILSAVIMVGASTAAFAETAPQTVTVEQQYGASAAKTWDGKTEMKAGQKYVLKKSVTITSKVTLPKGATLTLNKGAKLTIGAKGTLNVRGKLAVQSGASVVVTGKLVAYSGSTISNSGTITFSKNKAAVTLGGKFTVNKGGKVAGTPKSIKLGKNGKVTIKGTNSCKKLAALLTDTADTTATDKKEIENVLNTYVKKAITGDMYGAIKDVYPESYMKDLEDSFKEYAGISLEDFINQYYAALIEQSGVDAAELAAAADSIKITATKLTDCKNSLTDDQKAILADCGNITKAYDVELSATVDGDTASLSDYINTDTGAVRLAKAGGKWYLIG